MVILSFKTKMDKEKLLEKAKKMEEYASMIVDCIEECREEGNEYDERSYQMSRNYRHEDMDYPMEGRYGYRRGMR